MLLYPAVLNRAQIVLIGGPHLGLTVTANGTVTNVGSLERKGVGSTATCGAVAGLAAKGGHSSAAAAAAAGGGSGGSKGAQPQNLGDMEMDRLRADFKAHLGTNPVPPDMQTRTLAVAAMNWENLLAVQERIRLELTTVLTPRRTNWKIQTIPCMIINCKRMLNDTEYEYHTVVLTPKIAQFPEPITPIPTGSGGGGGCE